MNITDIDDKIILRARRNYLVDEYIKANGTLTEKVHQDVKTSLEATIQSQEKKLEDLKKSVQADKRRKGEAQPEINFLTERLSKLKENLKSLESTTLGDASTNFIEQYRDILGETLDKQTDSVDRDTIMRVTGAHSQKYEAEYLDDMRNLGIKTPDVLTRVSEYVKEIIDMTQGIINNGFGYESEGSVYFDTNAFDQHEDHFYAKLKPTCFGDASLLAEGEGSLSTTGEKKSRNDFALWKKSKPGEPSWDSPWGNGRPGWHIECSAMATRLLGNQIDIHAGGSDLMFPHHDNELAQSEAYSGEKQWVNYFLHAGHLHIDGLKMSKSLKNFITIKEILEVYTARQIRLLFLLQQWNSVMNYSKDGMLEAVTKERNLVEFFRRVDSVLDERKLDTKVESWNENDIELHNYFNEQQLAVHSAMCDNFATKAVLDALFKVITKCNSYMTNNVDRKAFLLKKIAQYITKILRVFGIVDNDDEFGLSSRDEVEESNNIEAREIIRPYVNKIVDLRTQIRDIVKTGIDWEKYEEISTEALKFRDHEVVAKQTVQPFVDILSQMAQRLSEIKALPDKDQKSNIFRLSDSVRDDMLKAGIELVDNSEFPFYFLKKAYRDVYDANGVAVQRDQCAVFKGEDFKVTGLQGDGRVILEGKQKKRYYPLGKNITIKQ